MAFERQKPGSFNEETSEIILNIVRKLEDETVVNFIAKKIDEMSSEIKINQVEMVWSM